MPELTNQLIEWKVIEYKHRKETCLVKFVNGFETTQVATRKGWAKSGRQGAWQHCAKFNPETEKDRFCLR